MNELKTDYLLKSLERQVDNVHNTEDEVREAGLAAIGIARDMFEATPLENRYKIEKLEQDNKFLQKTLEKSFDPIVVVSTMAIFLGSRGDRRKIKAIKNLRERTDLSLLDAKNLADEWEKMWDRNLI